MTSAYVLWQFLGTCMKPRLCYGLWNDPPFYWRHISTSLGSASMSCWLSLLARGNHNCHCRRVFYRSFPVAHIIISHKQKMHSCASQCPANVIETISSFTVRLHVMQAHGLAVEILSVCQTRGLWQNEIIVCQYINAVRYNNVSSFHSPTFVVTSRVLEKSKSENLTNTLQ